MLLSFIPVYHSSGHDGKVTDINPFGVKSRRSDYGHADFLAELPEIFGKMISKF
jgi:hypothetical protein